MQENKKEERAQEFAALTEEEKNERRLAQKRRKRERDDEKEQRMKKLKKAADNAPKIIIDLDFWDKMKEGEQVSLVSQLGFCVGANRKADAPCSLHYTRFDPLPSEYAQYKSFARTFRLRASSPLFCALNRCSANFACVPS